MDNENGLMSSYVSVKHLKVLRAPNVKRLKFYMKIHNQTRFYVSEPEVEKLTVWLSKQQVNMFRNTETAAHCELLLPRLTCITCPGPNRVGFSQHGSSSM